MTTTRTRREVREKLFPLRGRDETKPETGGRVSIDARAPVREKKSVARALDRLHPIHDEVRAGHGQRSPRSSSIASSAATWRSRSTASGATRERALKRIFDSKSARSTTGIDGGSRAGVRRNP